MLYIDSKYRKTVHIWQIVAVCANKWYRKIIEKRMYISKKISQVYMSFREKN